MACNNIQISIKMVFLGLDDHSLMISKARESKMVFVQVILILLTIFGIQCACEEKSPEISPGSFTCDHWEELNKLLVQNASVVAVTFQNQTFASKCETPMFNNFPNLEKLVIIKGSFRSVKERCFEGVKLTDIQLTGHPLEIFDMKSLSASTIERLWLSDNKLSEVKFEEVLPQLVSLDVSGNNLTTILIRSDYTPRLRILSLTNNKIRTFDIRATELFFLQLSNNKIEYFEEKFLDAPKLRMLYAMNNNLTTITSGLLNKIPRIEFAHFENNVIRSVNLTSFEISSLRWHASHIEISKSNSQQILLYLSWQNVTQLVLCSNKIKSLTFLRLTDQNLTIEQLSLTKNQIQVVKLKDLDMVPKLIVLDLSDNNISSIEEGALQKQTELHTLILRGNDLQVLPETLFYPLISIVSVDLSENRLQSFPIPGWHKSKNSVQMQEYHVIIARNAISVTNSTFFFCFSLF